MAVVSLFKEGRYLQTIDGPERLVIEPTIAAMGADWAQGALDETWWHDGENALKRLPYPAVLDGTTLRGVLPGSRVVIEGQFYECLQGGDIELSFQYAGDYVVWVALWPYLDGRYMVENPPPTK